MIAVESTIDAVKVYHRGATVTRLLTVEAGADGFPEQIEIPGLPLSLDDGTVRLSVREGDVVAADLRVGLYAKSADELPPEPDRDALRAAKRFLAVKRELLNQIEQEIALLSGIPVPTRPEGKDDEPPPPSPLAARVALEDFTDGAVRARQEEARAVREVIREREKEVADLQFQILRRSSAQTLEPSRVTKTVVATLRHSGAVQRAELVLEYFVPGCMWTPRYQVRVSRDGDAAVLTMRALIAQNSGEDWRGVKLLLSTADPQRWTELPKLSSIRIGKAQPAPAQRGFRPPPEGAQVLFSDWQRDSGKLTTSAPPQVPRGPAMGAHINVHQPVLEPSLIEVLKEYAPELPARPMMVGMAAGAGPGSSSAMESLMEAPSPSPPPALKAKRRRRSMSAPSPVRAEATRADRAMMPMEIEEELSLDDMDESYGGGGGRASAGQPAFALLRLMGPDRASMGALEPVDPLTTWRETLSRSGLRVNFDLGSVVSAAVARAAAVGALSLPSGTSDVRRAAANFDYAYPTESRVDVPSDGAFHSVPVGEREAGCALRYVVVPREDTNVFRIATLVNPTDEPLLPGPVEIYVGGEYVVTAALPAVAARARFQLGLGVEQAIKCARNTHFEEKRSGAAVVATAELWHSLDITLVNGLGRAITCEVRERIPQPDEGAEVVVEESEVTPAWSAYDQEERRSLLKGGRRWEVSIAPGTEQKLKARYVVKIYANNEIVGGNRREA